MPFPTSSASSFGSTEWRRTFDSINAGHDAVYRTIERAIKFEEYERPDLAVQAYKEAIQGIDETLAIPVEVPADPAAEGEQRRDDDSWQQAVGMIHKLKRTRGELLQRVGQLSGAGGSNRTRDGGRAPGEAGDAENARRPWTYSELATALREIAEEPGREPSDGPATLLELLFSCDGVRVYYIEPDGVVSRTMADSTLRVVRIQGDERRLLQTTVFLQVIETRATIRIENAEEPREDGDGEDGDTLERDTSVVSASVPEERPVEELPFLIYPLIPGVSPCYRTDFGAFILPDLSAAGADGRAIGLVIPSGADEVVMEILVAFLHGVVTQPQPGENVAASKAIRKRSLLPDSTTVSTGLIRGAFYLSHGLIRGAEKTGHLIATGTPYIISKLGQRATTEAGPDAEVPASVQVPQNVRTGIEMARSVTGTAAGVTTYVAGKVGSATMALGRFLAPHIQRHGSALLAYGTGMSPENASDRMNGALTICAGAVEGFGTVYEGLERSASILGQSLSSSTVQIVEHRYGEQAGRVVGSSLDTVGNVINVTHNMNYITPKGLAKRTAKNAGKALVAGYRPPIPELETDGARTSLFPPSSSNGAIGDGASAGPPGGHRIVPAGVLYPDLGELAKEVRQ